ncbi:nuclear anchorage protein 1 [Plectropomus leopardus]|uniref:nuclear anchorage protein 1 n=1 Tax=Plectropomus leopardus TaxID=160734 RepID=UPI001C4BACAC|nr:nuclear anchorage protein 1 [Plectropomus leopardus]
MGDAQSAQREDKKDAAAAEEEESGKVDDAQQNIEDEPLKKHRQIPEINGQADGAIAEVNGHCEDEIAAEAIISPDEEVSRTENQLKDEETPLNVEIIENESPNEADADEVGPLETTEMDAKQNDINESFRRFFSNIGLKLTVKRGSVDIATDVPDKNNKKEPNRAEDAENTTKENTSDNVEQNTDVNIVQEMCDNDSTTCPTLTDVTSEGVLETAEEKALESKEEVEPDNIDAATTSPVGEHEHTDATPEKEPDSTSPSSPKEEVVVSPIKRFFTTGIFSGLRKKKKAAEVETTDKELTDMEKQEVEEATEQTVQDQQQGIEEISLGVEAAAVETEHKENELKGESQPATITQKTDASTIDTIAIIVNEPDILTSQEKDKVQASPLKRLLSGGSLKRLSKKQRSRRSSDAKLSDSGEHVSDQLLSSTESAENQKEVCAQPSAEAAAEEDGAWASFKKLMTPKKLIKRSSLSNEDTQIPASTEPKPSEGGQVSDHSTDEGKKRKDSSVSWESVLCGSGKKRSRKTSDSEEESPQIDNEINKQDGGCKNGAESALESSNEAEEITAYSPKQAGSPAESDGGSTWQSLKRLVTPKRRAKDEDESKDNVQSDSEVSHDESSFSIKKLLPGRKKKRPTEKQDQVSSDEADKDVASGDDDSETPAVVPLSEFDATETEVHIQTQADIESHIPKEAAYELQKDLLDQMAEPVLPCDSLQPEANKVQENDDALENKASTTPASNEEPDDLTESISKPQLSDIPEEATPASATEEAARDDTIAEDLIEITSEAFTAPEPLDITPADETEMISAVSQLSSESSKTSGNTTPVPAEYDIMETDVLLHQVVETISISQKAIPVCSDELGHESTVVSVSDQILETFVKEEPTIVETQREMATSAINTDVNVQEVDAINELAASTQTDSTSEVNDSVSTEIISEVPTEEFETAEIAVDEVNDVNVIYQEDSLKELESIDESHHLVECLSEVNAVMSTDISPEGDKIAPDDCSLDVANQAEMELPKIYFKEAESAATVAGETTNGAMGHDVQTLTEKEDVIMHNITEQIQTEDKDQTPIEMKELQELATVQAATLDSVKASVQMLEEDIILEGIPGAETATHELKEEKVLTEVSAEPEKEDELETDAAETEHVQVPEKYDVMQASICDSEAGSIHSFEKLVLPEDFPEEQTVTDELQEEKIHLYEANLEPLDASKTEHTQDPEVLQAIQAVTFDSEKGSVQSLEKNKTSEDIPAAETDTYELKEETVLTEVSVEQEKEDELESDAAKPEKVKISELSEVVQASILDLVNDSVQSPEEEIKSEDIQAVETFRDEPQEKAISPTEVNLEPLDASKIEHTEEPDILLQAATLDSEECSVQSLEKDVKSEDIPAVETVTYEHKEASVITKVNAGPAKEGELETVVAKPEQIQVPDASEAVQTSTLDSEEVSGQSPEEKVKVEDNPSTETPTDEPIQSAEHLTEISVEAENKKLPVNVVKMAQDPEALEAVQATTDSEEGSVQPLEKEQVDAFKSERAEEPEVLQDEQAATLDSEMGRCLTIEKEVISEDIPAVETVTYEHKEASVITKVNAEPAKEDELETVVAKPEQIQVPDASEAVQASTLDSEEVSGQSPKEKLKSEDIPPPETDEPNQTADNLTQVSIETENKEVPVNAFKILQEPHELKAVQAPKDSEEGTVHPLEKEVISEDVPEAKTFTDEPTEETMPLAEANIEPVDADKSEQVQVPEASEAVQTSTLDSEEGSVQSPEEKVKFEDNPPAETPTDEPIQITERLTEISVEAENKKLPVNAVKMAQDPEALEAVQATTDSEEGSVQPLEKEVISGDDPEAKTVTDEPKEETMPLSELPLEQVDAFKSEHVQEPEVLQDEQAATLDSEVSRCLTVEKDVISEDIPAVETVTYEHKEPSVITEINAEPAKEDELETVAAKPEQIQVPDVSEAVQASTLDSEEVSGQSPEEKVKFEDNPSTETPTDEPIQTAEHLTEISVEAENKKLPVNAVKMDQDLDVLEDIQAATDSEESSVQPLEKEQVDAFKSEHAQEPEVLQDEQAATLDSEVGRCLTIEKEVISEDIPAVETVTYEHKEASVITKVNVEPAKEDELETVAAEISVEAENKKLPVNAVKMAQDPDALEAVQATTDSEEGSVQPLEKEVISGDDLEAKTVTDEPKEETMPLTELPLERVDAFISEHVQEPEVLQDEQAATLDSEVGRCLTIEKEVISEDIQGVETVTDESKQETKVRAEPEEKLPLEAAKMEHAQEQQILQAVQTASADSEMGWLLPLAEKVISEDIQALEKITDELEGEAMPHTQAQPESLDASKTENIQESEVLHAVQASTVDSEEGCCLSLVKKVKSEDIPAVETVTDESNQDTEVRVEPEKKLPLEDAKMEHAQEQQILHAVQTETADSEVGRLVPLAEKVISEEIQAVEKITDESEDEAMPQTQVQPESLDASKTENIQESEVLKAVQASTVDSEAGSFLSLEKEAISKDILAVEMVTDEHKEENMPFTQVELQPVDASKTEYVQATHVPEKEVISEDILALGTVTDEPKQEQEVNFMSKEKLPAEAAQTEHVQEPQALSSDVKGIATETKTEEGSSMYGHVVTENVDGSTAQELKTQKWLENVSKKNADNVIASVTDKIETQVVAQLDHSFEKTAYQKKERIPQDMEQEDGIPDGVDELQTLTAVFVSSVNEDASNSQALEKTVFTEDTPTTGVDNTAVINEPKHAVQVCDEGEKESELAVTVTKTAADEHAMVMQVVVCELRDVSAAVSDVLIDDTSVITEPFIDRVTSELEYEEEVEATTPLEKDDVAEAAKEGSEVEMMYVPSVEFEDNCRIQVQVVDVDVKLAEAIVETVLEAGVTKAKEVIHVCYETAEKVDSLSTTIENEEELRTEENKVTIQEVTQHVKENLFEMVPELDVDNLEQEGIKQQDAVKKVTETGESESNETEDQKAKDESIATFKDRHEEAPAVISEDSGSEQKVPEDLAQTLGNSDVSIHDQKDDSEETKSQQEKSEAVTAEEMKLSSEKLNVEEVNEAAQITQSPPATPCDSVLLAPQNTGIISSTGHVESPSSLSFEFKFNVQFGQTKAPTSPPQTTETEVSDVRVQLKSTEKVISDVQQPEQQTKKREVLLTQTVLSETDGEETKTEAHVTPKEEENDQDVWMDAEEDIYTQEETELPVNKEKESLEEQTEGKQDENTGLEQEFEMAPDSQAEEESQQEMHKTVGTSEVDSEGEDFAVALEHPETEITSVTTME